MILIMRLNDLMICKRVLSVGAPLRGWTAHLSEEEGRPPGEKEGAASWGDPLEEFPYYPYQPLFVGPPMDQMDP